MFRLPLVIVYAVMAFLCWGAYGPMLHEGQLAMAHNQWRPFVCIGIAYFLVAVLIPSWITRTRIEKGRWTFSGIVWSLIAGVLGCLGSLGIIVAFNLGGSPYYVMPLVFGGAPVINTLVTLATTRHRQPHVVFYLGIAMVALGAAGVLYFKPQPVTAHAVIVPAGSLERYTAFPPGSDRETVRAQVLSADVNAEASPDTDASRSGLFLTCLAIIATAFCWGCYGPTLHQGQSRMEGSRLRPFICVGVAYFFIAILVPLFILASTSELGGWTARGCLLSLIAGALGALGALGVILAFNAGGKPVFVMPIVFGGAPVVNTFVTTGWNYLRHGQMGDIRETFLLSLVLVIAGAVTVLLFAPRGHESISRPSAAAGTGG